MFCTVNNDAEKTAEMRSAWVALIKFYHGNRRISKITTYC